jgi:ribose transport system permease protein
MSSTTEAAPAAPAARFTVASLRGGGLVAAVILIAAAFTVIEPAFVQVDVMLGTLRSTSSLAIMALGLTLVVIAGEVDLSFGAVNGLVANLLAWMWIVQGVPIYLAIVAALLAAVAVGVLNGVVVTVLKVPSFIVTLGTYNLVYGFTLLVSGLKDYNPDYPPEGTRVPEGEIGFFKSLASQSLPFDVPAQVLWLVAFVLVFAFLIHRSLFGFRLMAIGGNPVAARLAGLPVTRYKILVFVIGALMAGVAGILDFAFIHNTQPDLGLAATFPVFAAVIIGGASLTGGRGTVSGTVMGSLLLGVLAAGLALVAAGPFAQQVFLGGVTIGAVILDRYTARQRDA